MRKRPLKPAKQVATLVFPKRGSPWLKSNDWPRVQGRQELVAVQVFASRLFVRAGRQLDRVSPLSEADHDVEAWEGDTRVEIQVTELVTYPYVLEELGPGAYRLDIERMDDALADTIDRKRARYARNLGARLILLVYCIDVGAFHFIETTTTRNDGMQELVVPEGLRRARERLLASGPDPFDEVWYIVPLPDGDCELAAVFPSDNRFASPAGVGTGSADTSS